MISFLWFENSQKFTKKHKSIKILPKTVLVRNIALIFNLEKLRYLEKRVVREPCKRRSACNALILWIKDFSCTKNGVFFSAGRKIFGPSYFVTALGISTFWIIYRTRTIITRSWILTIHKDRFFGKKLLENKEMVFQNGVKNIHVAAYNGARTVCIT